MLSVEREKDDGLIELGSGRESSWILEVEEVGKWRELKELGFGKGS